MLEKKLTYIELYDEYHLLLTDKQRNVFELHYHGDLSFTEIAEALSISKQAVSDAIRKTCAQLEQYENKLQFIKRSKMRNAIVDNLLENNLPLAVKNSLTELRRL